MLPCLQTRYVSLRSQAGALPAARAPACRRVVLARAAAGPEEGFPSQLIVDRRAVMMSGLLTSISLAQPAAARTSQQAPSGVEQVTCVWSNMVAGKPEEVLPQLSKDVVLKFPVAYSGDELGGEYRGRYGALKYISRLDRLTTDLKVSDLKAQPGDGKDQVIARFRMSGRMVASNAKFSTSVTQVWTLSKDGQVAAMTSYYDTASLAKAAGVKADK